MTTLKLFYATNRRHKGTERWRPTGYGTEFSTDGEGNLRFGGLTIEADDATIKSRINETLKGNAGFGNGEKLAEYFSDRAKTAVIAAYKDPELVEKDDKTPKAELGAQGMFGDLQTLMKNTTDVLIYIHGFNVNWHEAVGSALALQEMLKKQPGSNAEQDLVVVLFTWPSDGKAIPWSSYKSDRREARGSGEAVARGVLKLRDYLVKLRRKDSCGQDIHLLCHSMGNFLLQSTLQSMVEHETSSALPRTFEHIFMCAPDVDDNVLEPGQPLGRLHEIARLITIYHNHEDNALRVSNHTKGNPDRLGTDGAARPVMLHQKIHQVDCTPIVRGVIEHSYYLCGTINADIRKSIDGVESDNSQRARERVANYNNVWKMKPAS